MANYRYIQATGNVNTLANWEDDSTGSWAASTVLPGASDVAYANGKTITINITYHIGQWRTDAITGVTAGGTFTYGANSLVVTGDAYAGASTCLTLTNRSDCQVIGDLYGSPTTSNACGMLMTPTTTFTHTGDCIGGGAVNAYGLFHTSGVITLNLIGNQIGGSISSAHGFNGPNISGYAIIQTGDAIANAANGMYINGAGAVVKFLNATASELNDGVFVMSGVTAEVSGTLTNTTAKMALNKAGTVNYKSTCIFKFYDLANNLSVFSSGGSGSADYPAVEFVSKGIVYDNGNKTGTAINTEATIKTAVADVAGTLFEAFNP